MSAINEWFGGYCCMFRYIGRTYGEQELHRYFTYLAQTAYGSGSETGAAKG